MPAKLIIRLDKLRDNAARLTALCRQHGIETAFVTKCVCADPAIVAALNSVDFKFLADSRLDNIARYPKTDKKKMLLRLPEPSEAERVAALCDVSLNSEPETLRLLGQAAQRIGKRHGVMLMIDMGDLREGVFFKNTDEILATARLIHEHPGLELTGVGVNLTCNANILPTPENLGGLCDVARLLRRELGADVPMVSGGNSSSVYLLPRGEMPDGINNLRLGEVWLRGVEAAFMQPFMDLARDAVTLEAEIIELKTKPSVPVGITGANNAFGEMPEYENRGDRLRAILAVGRQDVDHTGLTPLLAGVEMIGASSDHLLADLTDCAADLKVGDRLTFGMTYPAILRAFSSAYVAREYRGFPAD